MEVRLVLVGVVERSTGFNYLNHIFWRIHHFAADFAFFNEVFAIGVGIFKWLDEILGLLFGDPFVALVDRTAFMTVTLVLVEERIFARQSSGHNKFSI